MYYTYTQKNDILFTVLPAYWLYLIESELYVFIYEK